LQVDRRFPVGDSTHNGAIGTGVTTVNSAVQESVRRRRSYNRRKRW
jgi:phytoene dehydrogenase-like protein